MKIKNWRIYPLCLLGYNIIRWEYYNLGVINDIYDWTFKNKLICLPKDKVGGPSHIQYHSPWGFLLTWPLCFHFWWTFNQGKWSFHEGNPISYHVPGSEKVLFISIGFARWDAEDGCYMVPRCYIGGHYD